MHHVGNDFTKNRKVVIKCPKCRIARTDAALTHGFDWLDNVAIAAWNQRIDVADLEAQLAAEYKRMAEVVKAAESLLGLCINCGDFRNGNTAYGIDEGEVGAGKIIAKLEQALAGLEG